MARMFTVLIPFVIGAVSFLGAGSFFRDTWSFVARSHTARGRLVGQELVVSETSDGQVEGYYPVFSFETPDGQKHTFRGNFASFLSPRTGQAVEVLYDPGDPSSARLKGFFTLWTPTLLLGGIGIISIGAGVLAVMPSGSAKLGRVVLRIAAFEVFGPYGQRRTASPGGGQVKARSLGMADKLLMEHLTRGGAVTDSIGREVVRQLVERASEEPRVRKVIQEQHAAPDELAAIYAAVIEDLMPEPCIDAPPPVLVPTQFFREPERLREVLAGVARGATPPTRASQLVARAVAEGRRIRQEANDDPERSKVVFNVTPAGGLDLSEREKVRRAWSEGLGCATTGLVPLSMGLLWTGWALYGEYNPLGLGIGVLALLAGLCCIHLGLHMLPWPANLIAGLVILGAGGGWLWSTERFVASAARTEGVVTGFGAGQDVTPVIHFSPERGAAVEFTVWTPWHRKLREDERVAVLYDRDFPARAALDSFATLWLNAACLTLFGAALVASVLYVQRNESAASS